jgi:tetraacyldisaccharide 4'-kinase
MEGDFIKINEWLQPLSWFYGAGVGFRNFLFEVGILKSRAFQTPVISVGNITVGGTGKTPHVEYLVRLLQDRMRVAVLSRGYKRKSRGFMIADEDTPMKLIGDEPYQMKQKFPHITVAVDKKRTRGINLLESAGRAPDVVLLDDAFQHRYVKPGISILLVDYHRLVIYDKLLPAGRLREPLKAKDRADVVIVTKCPKELKPMDYRVITKAMNLYPYQHLFFTTLDYEPLRPVFNKAPKAPDTLLQQNVLLLTGIASPQQLLEDMKPQVKSITPLTFADHHDFSPKDIQRLNETFAAMTAPKCIVTTEKDAARLTQVDGLSDEVIRNLYALPVRISFMLDQEEVFNNLITGYVIKNSRTHIVAQQKDDNKPKDEKAEADDKPKKIVFR